ncbi:bromodomain adjacent to zinc finger domain protein 1A [Xiphophorus couchianus]|uniref:bromodomain adjacent to zinc finger domain protein 1A n=1 Tax=Xiphophorus couchianus TaxID=32473 RepID=UPI0010166946|nr:bromodomain adjacent to zinc finger domain protein 1A [Xiphophorus couchianus]XP_027891150.1 bromodomain adjacent to zinc finger domain protein 1A [Xiphophorus couchianus]
MPLLHRKPFTRQKPPADLRPDEEVFLCKITHEIFRTYDEFFERTILCNSLVWSCALTGRAGLTYLEAVESERRAKQSLESFPQALVVPMLHLAALSRHCRLSELCEDVYGFVKDRFFPGEIVDVSGRNGTRRVCEIVQVLSLYACANGAPLTNRQSKAADSDTIVISDSDDESDVFQSPTAHLNGGKKPLSPSAFNYRVRIVKDESGEPFTVKASQISRKKTILSRERLKLLFKQHCEPQRGCIVLKPSTVKKYRLSEQTFSQFFPDDPPIFPFSLHSNGSPGQASSINVLEEKLMLLQRREEMAAAGYEKARLKREKEEAQEARRREREGKDRLREEQRQRFEEEKQRKREERERRKLEKDREREKLKEEKKKYAQRLKLWNKPREDMECEDLKELPSPMPVRTRLPSKLFGEALMVLEFLRAFGEAFDLKDEFPEGITLEVLEEALVGTDPEGPLCELLFFFLTAIFQALDEEQEEVAKDQAEDLWEALDDDSDPTQSALTAVASLAAAWPQLHQGSGLKQLDLDSCTLSEILRLYILASGADCNHSNAKFRYQKQGGFTVMDDPCVELRLSDPALLKRLSCTPVYDLTPAEKLKILLALVGKLLTLASSRDLIEDCVDEQKAARQELREIRAEQHRRKREEIALRARVRKEEKLREQELRLREKKERLKERLQANGETAAEAEGEQRDKNAKENGLSSTLKTGKAGQDEDGQQQQMHSDSKPCGLSSNLSPEELEKEQEKVQELLQRIQKAAACTCLLPLGKDRLFRRYWLIPSACALFVEEDFFGLTEDMLLPCPKPSEDAAANMEDTKAETEQPGENAGSSLSAHGVPVNRPNQWYFYSSIEEVDQLIEALNPRGHRESGLREALLQDRDKLQLLLQSCDQSKYRLLTTQPGNTERSPCSASAESRMEVRLRDLLLDLEDRIHQGSLGTLKVMDRHVWRSALEEGNYELLASEGKENCVINGQVEPMEVDSGHIKTRDRGSDRLQELKSEATGRTSGSETPQVISSSVRVLAQALGHIEQGIERRFLKPPLGDEDSKKDQKVKKNKKKDEDQASDDGSSDGGRVGRTVLDRWRESLQACSSSSQVFVHLSSLERSVLWSRSVLNARCRVCRRKGDADSMLLCDGCDRGHHTHCLRPRLKHVPEGSWFCPDCRPKQRSSRLPSRQRSSIDEDEEEEDEENGEEDDSEEEEESEEEEDDEEEEDEEEEEEVVAVSAKKSQAAPPKGKPQQTMPKTQQTTPKGQTATPKGQQAPPKSSTTSSGKNSSASKTSGKKASASSSKANTTPSDRAPSRSGQRASTRLSNEIPAPKSNVKTSPGQREVSKKPSAEATPPKPSKTVLPVLPTTSLSSSRRSSGRNQGVHELSACEQLTVELVRHEDSWPFMKLVSKTQVPDYYDIITKPIALSTIREKVNNCEYQTAGDYISDVELMFSNCLQYNPRHTNEAKAGMRLQQFFHSALNRLGLRERCSAPPAKRSRQ